MFPECNDIYTQTLHYVLNKSHFTDEHTLDRNCTKAYRTGLSIVPVVPWEGPPPPSQRGPRRSAVKFLPHCFDVWTFSVRNDD